MTDILRGVCGFSFAALTGFYVHKKRYGLAAFTACIMIWCAP